uniref:phosphatidate cytidylyltransferase n=1 Tax=Macrostomum lignano TaxID=282301 RepID=A0A1I8F3D7_9PLAT
ISGTAAADLPPPDIILSLLRRYRVGFVVSLVKKHYLKQFTLFGWTHVTLLFLITSSHLMIRNVFDGVIWVILPCAMIICNDMMAYVFGFFFGRTPLIKLSPKKTWEGFLGGGFSTIVFSLLLGHCLIQFDSMVCPIEYDELGNTLNTNCSRHPVFQPVQFRLPFAEFLALLSSIPWYQFHWHTICMASFASIVARSAAFSLPDFSNTIPGHGGVMDRFDCQIIMGIFVYVYFHTFIMVTSPHHLLRQVYSLRPSDQLKFYEALTEGLAKRGIVPAV